MSGKDAVMVDSGSDDVEMMVGGSDAPSFLAGNDIAAATADPVLLPLLQAAYELSSSSSTTNSKQGATASSATALVASIRPLVLKVLSEPKLFAGYDQIYAALKLDSLIMSSSTSTEATASSGKNMDELRRIGATLQLFSYGTIRDYLSSTGSENKKYLTLSDTQLYKLRQLSLLTLIQQEACQKKKGMLYYRQIQDALLLSSSSDSEKQASSSSISSMRAVEDLLISCVYAHVLTGQLCQKTKAFYLTANNVNASLDSTIDTAATAANGPSSSGAAAAAKQQQQQQQQCVTSRDVPIDQVPSMLDMIQRLQNKIQASKRMLHEQRTAIQRDGTFEYEQRLAAKNLLKHAKSKTKGIVTASPNYENDPMAAAAAVNAAAIATGQQHQHHQQHQQQHHSQALPAAATVSVPPAVAASAEFVGGGMMGDGSGRGGGGTGGIGGDGSSDGAATAAAAAAAGGDAGSGDPASRRQKRSRGAAASGGGGGSTSRGADGDGSIA